MQYKHLHIEPNFMILWPVADGGDEVRGHVPPSNFEFSSVIAYSLTNEP